MNLDVVKPIHKTTIYGLKKKDKPNIMLLVTFRQCASLFSDAVGMDYLCLTPLGGSHPSWQEDFLNSDSNML